MKLAPGAWRYALVPVIAAPFALFYSVLAALASAALGGAILGFFRDPDRSPPPRGVVAPADGKVSVLREEPVPGSRDETRVRLGVFMNVWNVHVARAPFDGAVAEVEHTPGANRPAFSKDSDRNERVHVRFRTDGESEHDESGGGNIDGDDPDTEIPSDREVTLIAGAFARRIHPYVEPGDAVERGQRIGHIAFGSRVDVCFPPEIEIDDVRVEPGERVTAGETVVLDALGRSGAVDPTIDEQFQADVESSGTTGLATDDTDPAADADGDEGDRSWT